MKKIIELNIVDEFVEGGGVSIGAAGSHDEVLLRCRFSELWEGTTKTVTWINAIGVKTPQLITPQMEAEDGTIMLSIPYECKDESGKAGITFEGVLLNKDGSEESSVVTKTVYFTVQEAILGGEGEKEEVLPDTAEQLQAEINEIKETIFRAIEAAILSESWAAGGTGKREDEEYNNAEYFARLAERFAIAGIAGVTAFKNRIGHVRPKKGDYTSDMVGALARSVYDADGDDVIDNANALRGFWISFYDENGVYTPGEPHVHWYEDENGNVVVPEPGEPEPETPDEEEDEYLDIPTKLSQLHNDVGYITEKQLQNVEGKIPTKTSQLTNDSNFAKKSDIPTSLPASDVPDWSKQPEKPTYTKSEVGLGNVDNEKQYSASNPPPYPVTSVNGSTGAVEVEPKGTAQTKVTNHNADDEAHNDIRLLIAGLTERFNAFMDSDDDTLDQASEFVEYIKANRSLIESITTTKVNVSDIIDNLTTSVSNKPLSAKQGVQLKALIDAITVPTALSQLASDSTHRTVTDTEKSTWNNKSDFSGSYNDLTNKPTIPTVPTKVSAFANDAGYQTAQQVQNYAQPKGKYVTETDFAELKNYVTPQMFGAVADGVTDDTEAINLAIESAGNNGIVFFPEGIYLVSSSMDSSLGEAERYIAVKVFEKENITLQLSSKAHIKHKAFTEDELVSAGTTRYYIIGVIRSSNVKVLGGIIEGEAAEHTYHTYQGDGTYSRTHGYGINIYSSNDVAVKDCEIFNCYGDGVHISISSGSSKSRNATIENCKIHDCIRLGIGVTGADNTLIKDCEIYNIVGASPQSGIDFEPDYVTNMNINSVVENCLIYDCAAYAMINAKANKGMKVRDCRLYGKISSTCDDTYPIEYINCDILWYQSSNAYRNILHNCRIASCGMYEMGDDFYDCTFNPDLFNHIIDGYGATVASLLESGSVVLENSQARFYRCEFISDNSGGYASNFVLWRNNGKMGSALFDSCRFLLGLHSYHGVNINVLTDLEIVRCIFVMAETTYTKQLIELNVPNRLLLKDNIFDIRALTVLSGYSSLIKLSTKDTYIEGCQILATNKVCTYPILQTFVGDVGEIFVLRNYMPLWDMLGSLTSATASKFISAGNILSTTESEVVFTSEDKDKLNSINDIISESGFITEAEAKGYTDTKIAELTAQGVQQTPLFVNTIEECTNTAKLYVLPDGYVYAYMAVEKEVEDVPTYTNLLPLAVNADGTDYIGTNGEDGYKVGYRLNSSKAEVAASGMCCSGFIPIKPSSVIRFKNITVSGASSPYVFFFKDDRTTGEGVWTAYVASYFESKYDAETGVYTIDTTASDVPANTVHSQIGCMRVSFGNINENTIITCNEEITESNGGSTTVEYEWVNTGLAFVPADYESRILALEEKVANL